MERAIYERMAAIDGEHWWFAARREIVSAIIRAQVPLQPDARILEVGCGTGSNIAFLQGFGRVDAIEPDGPARELASERSGIPVRAGFLPEDGATIEDHAYDLIVLLDVLEHIPQDGPALEVLRTKLAPGGRILVTVPAMQWLWSEHDAAHHHHRRYTAKTLTRVFEASGLRLRHRTYFNTLLFPLIAGARAIGRLTGREGGDDAMPPGPLNRALKAVFGAEARWVARSSLPLGVSLAAVAEPVVR